MIFVLTLVWEADERALEHHRAYQRISSTYLRSTQRDNAYDNLLLSKLGQSVYSRNMPWPLAPAYLHMYMQQGKPTLHLTGDHN